MEKTVAKVFVSGCFDLLHSGHVAFFEEAAGHGDLYVGIGSDNTIAELKGRSPVNTEEERLYMVKALRTVKDAWINAGSGFLDFIEDIKTLRPDIFFVNTDGYNREKEKLCAELGIRLVVSERKPHENLPYRSTTSYREECRIPYRIDLAGGWLDQPAFSRLAPGPVLTLSIEPTMEFLDLAGMATSTRKKAIDLWSTHLPPESPEKLARVLFSYENPPGTQAVSGSQDALGMILPGLNKLDYAGNFWPSNIVSCDDESVLRWLEEHICLVFVAQRRPEYDPYPGADITRAKVKNLADAAEACWSAALRKDFAAFAQAFLASFEAQIAMLPSMMTNEVAETIAARRADAAAWKMVGAGGGGYMAFLSERLPHDGIRIRARRKEL